MNNIFRGGISDECVLFKMMLIFVLVASDNTEVRSAEEIIKEHNTSGDPKIKDLRFTEYKQLRKGEFKKVVEEIDPVGLHISNASLTDEDIKNTMLNKSIEVFILNGSKITDMHKLFGSWNKKLVKVDISSNRLTSLPTGLKNVPGLKELYIKKNPLIFMNWNKLSVEDINKYKESGSFTTLDILNMDFNLLGMVDEVRLSSFLELFPNITDLSMSYAELPRTISIPFENLERLDISCSSKLEEIKHTKDNPGLFIRLEELNVYGCERLSIDNEFIEKLKNVKYLNIMDVSDKSKYDYGAVCKLEKLRVLCIEEDKIDIQRKFTSESVNIVYTQDDYLKLVREELNREKEKPNRKIEKLSREKEKPNRRIEELNKEKKEHNRRIEELNKEKEN